MLISLAEYSMAQNHFAQNHFAYLYAYASLHNFDT